VVFDLLTSNLIIEIFFVSWIVHMCDMVTLSGGKGNVLEPRNHIATLMSSVLDLSPFDSRFDREHLPTLGSIYVCGMVTLGGRGNVLEPRNRISTSMSSALDILPFDPNSIGNMCDMVTLGGKGNIPELGNHIFTSMSSAFDL
jgi:hypothetical protein